jgi:hypothetical protein
MSFATSRLGQAAGEYSNWKGLYQTGSVAALVSVLLIPVAIISHIAWPPPAWSPGAAIDWFTLFQSNWLRGLLGLDLSILIGLVLGIPIFLALYVALRQEDQSAMAIATTIALIGTALHLTSNTAFEMLALSRGYAAAVTEAERTMFLAAGEATLAAYYGSAFHVSYILGYVAKIIIGAIMLRGNIFSKTTGYVGILTGISGLGFYLPAIGMLFSIISVVFVAVWNVLIARRLFQLA